MARAVAKRNTQYEAAKERPPITTAEAAKLGWTLSMRSVHDPDFKQPPDDDEMLAYDPAKPSVWRLRKG